MNEIYTSTLGTVLGEKKGIISVDSSATVEEAFQLLALNKIHSIAVKEGEEYIGIVNRVDILTSIAFDNKHGEKPDFKAGLHLPVKDILGLTRESRKLHQFQTVDYLPVLLNAFSSGIHSVLVNDAAGKPVGFLSQSDVVNFLWKNKDKLGEWAHKAPVRDVIATRPVKSLNHQDVTLLAFRELLINEIPAAPVVGEDGKAVAVLSLSDLGGIDMHNLGYLLQTIPEFLRTVHGKDPIVVGAEEKEPIISLIEKVTTRSIHQLWLLEDGKPKAAISLSDIIITFFTQQNLGPQYFSTYDIFKHYYSHSHIKPEYKDVLNVPISNLIKEHREAVGIDAKETQRAALEKMSKEKVLSLPVVRDGQYIGIVSAFDILTVLVFNSKFAKPAELDAKFISERLPGLDEPVSDCLGASSESSFFPKFEEKDSLSKLLFSFVQGVHRALINSEDGKTAKILSQTDILHYLLQNISSLGAITSAKVETLVDCSGKKIIGLDSKTTALAGFRQIIINEVRAAPVLDGENHLIASLSSSAVKGLTQSAVSDLLLSLEEFIKKHNGGELKEPITCTKDESLESVLKKIVNGHVHRIWVVDGSKVVGVVSQSDLIGAIYLDKMEKE